MATRQPLLMILFAWIACGAVADEKPLKVFVLVGQSNMQGHAHVRTLKHLSMDPETRSILDEIQNQQGQPRVFDQIWISYLSSAGIKTGRLTTGFGADENKIGPELTFGITMQRRLGEPILIIKTAWGGKSLNTDFRPPGAGPYEFDDSAIQRMKKQGKDMEAIKADKDRATGVYYRHTIDHVKSVLSNIRSVYPDYDPDRGYQLAGLVWFQGWNDMVDGGTYPQRGKPGGYDQYSKLLVHLIHDLRADLDAPRLPFIIGVMGVGGPTANYSSDQQRYRKIHQSFRDAMSTPASLQEFQGNVFAVLTENAWDQELDAIVKRDSGIRNSIQKAKKSGELRQWIQSQLSALEIPEEERRQLLALKNDNKLAQAWLEIQRASEFSPREIQILQNGSSNAAFHYLGSAKIMARIGRAFADAIPLADDSQPNAAK